MFKSCEAFIWTEAKISYGVTLEDGSKRTTRTLLTKVYLSAVVWAFMFHPGKSSSMFLSKDPFFDITKLPSWEKIEGPWTFKQKEWVD